jgi:hypothetical protein
MKNYPTAFLLSYLIPGWGHFYLGKKKLGLFFCFCVVSVYTIGALLGGGVLWDEMNILTILAYTVKFFNGLPFFVTFIHQIATHANINFNEIGTTFILVSGALNLLIMIHLFDVIREKTEGQCQEPS